MTANIDSNIRSGEVRLAFEQLDERIRAWALDEEAEEQSFPVLIDADILRRAEYPEAFPHLLMAPAVAADPARPMARGNVLLTRRFLSPAVCYHAYAGIAHSTVDGDRTVTARGRCFRNEEAAELVPGRRQVEFEMRELILIGAPSWIEERLADLKPGVEALAGEFGLEGQWQAASDPFFLPRAQGKAHMQRILGTKVEFCLPTVSPSRASTVIARSSGNGLPFPPSTARPLTPPASPSASTAGRRTPPAGQFIYEHTRIHTRLRGGAHATLFAALRLIVERPFRRDWWPGAR